MRFGVLGPLEVEADQGPVVVGGQKERLLLALLLTRPNRVVPVEALIQGLWGEHPPATAAKTLQSHVMRLRRVLEPGRGRGAAGEVLVTREPGYLLRVAPGMLDVARFEELTQAARRELADGSAQAAASMLRQALGLWRGQAFEEFLDSDVGAAEAERLGELRLVAVEDRLEADLQLGRHREVVAELEGLVREQPLRERLWAQLLLALYRAGRQADALLAYQRARSILVEELGIDPGTELRRLHAAILAQDPGLDLPAADVGPSRELPEALQPVGPAFVGRAAELAWLRAAWTRAAQSRGGVALVAGGRGMGKTRLAAELARQVHDRGGWVLYGRCAAVASDPLQPFEQALAGAGVSVRDLPVPSAGGSPAAFGEVLAGLLAGRTEATVLLVVDDLHLAQASALEALAGLVGAAATRRLLVVGTYREEADAPGLAALLERLDPGGAACRRLGPLDRDEVAQVLGLYQGERAALAAAGPVLDATGGVPLLVHQAAADRAQAQAANQLEEMAGRTVSSRGQLRLVQAQLADDVVDLRELREHSAQVARLASGQHPPGEEPEDRPAVVVCPYKGLVRFEPDDAGFFFGRERLVAELVTHLVGAGLVGVVGPSGSGKSSLVRAGLLPALAEGVLPGSDRWRQVLVRPGEHPMRELGVALGANERITAAMANGNSTAATSTQEGTAGPVLERAADNLILEAAAVAQQRLLLVVDQFEEVFTSCRDEPERARFLAVLTQAAQATEGSASIVIAVRADYYGHCAAHPDLAALLAANHVLVGPMDSDELCRAIELPARRAGLQLDPGLAEAMIGEVAAEPGGLPLLSCALLESWQYRHGRTLTLAAYRQAGGVRGAVARLAERAWRQLAADQQTIARRVLLRLAGPGKGEAVVRRRVPLSEFTQGADQRGQAVVDVLADQRLLTKSHDSVEVAHEALLREWPRLRGWLEEDVQGRALHRHLIGAAQEWDRSGRDPGELYRAARLTGALDWAATHDADLNQLEREFLDAGRAAAEREVADARQRAEQEAHTSRRLRGLLTGLAAVLVLALVAGGLALSLRGRAEHQALVADSRRLGAQALLEDELDRSLLLARQAAALDDSVETRSDLLAALLRSPAAAAILPARLNGIGALALSARGQWLAVGEADGTVSIFDTRTRRLMERFQRGARSQVDILESSPDGKTLAINIGSPFDPVHLWDVQHARLRHDLLRRGTPEARTRSVLNSVAFSTDGGTLFTLSGSLEDAAGGPGYLTAWDVSSGRRLRGPVKVSSHGGVVLRATPDGRHLVVVDGTDTLVLEARSFRLLHRFPHALTQPRIFVADLSPRDGRTLAFWPVDGRIELMDLATGRWRPLSAPQQGYPGSIRFSPDGKTLATGGATGGNDKTVRVWDVASGQLRETFQGHEARVMGLRFSPDSRTLYSAASRTVIAWDLEGSRRLGRPFSLFTTSDRGVRPPHSPAVSPDGTLVAAPDGKEPDHLALRDLRFPKRARRLLAPGVGQIGAVAFRPDSKRLAVGGDGATAPVLVDVASGRVLLRMTGGGRGPGDFFTVQFDPKGRLLVTTGWSTQQAVIWDTATGRAIRHLHHPTGEEFPALLAAWSPDGSTVATTGGEGKIVLWRAADEKQIATITADRIGLLGLGFSRDGSLLAVSGIGDWAVTLWNVATHRLVGRMPLPIYATTVAFDPHGKLLAASGQDGKVHLFDVASRREIGTSLPGDGFGVPAFDPTGTHLIVVYEWGPVLVWDIDPERWKQQACTVAGRSLTREEWQELLPGRRYQPACQ